MVVSHDRYLLRTVADASGWWPTGGRRFDGDLEDYRKLLGERRNAQASAETEDLKPAVSRKDQRRQDAEKRQQLRPFQQALGKAEAALEKLAKAKAEVESRLADPAIYEPGNKERLQTLLLEKAGISRQLEETETAWLEAGEALETAENAYGPHPNPVPEAEGAYAFD